MTERWVTDRLAQRVAHGAQASTASAQRGAAFRRRLVTAASGAVLAVSAPGWAAEGPAAPSEGAAPPAAAAKATTPCVCDPQICDKMVAEPDPNDFRHDGFFLRLTGGPGYTWGRGTPSAELNGYAGALGVSAGAMILDNFGVYLDFYGSNAFRSGLSLEGSEDTTFNVVLQTSSLGLGATYYLMPANVYVAFGVGGGWLYTTAYSRVDETFVLTGAETSKFGPTVSLSLGKEWWVHPAWGVGMAAVYNFLSVNGEEDGKYTVDAIHNVTVRVSATFN